MTPELREKYRQTILVALLAVRPLSMALPAINQLVSSRGYDDDEEAVARELDYLSRNGLARLKDKLISPAARRWQITDTGVSYLEEEGLA
ncbi:MAG: hypothetical protein LBK99_00740 [Opitutaceae bacterium]|jgi:hypothetical protein|nr:hypothetical protein [Opitutaceae bacterium]